MKIAIGSDHAAYELKEIIVEYLNTLGHEVHDVGTRSKESTDYPIYAARVAKLIQNSTVERGILICGTGIGIGITANKFKGIRACICSEAFSARMSVEHNNANVLAFGARVVGVDVAKEIVNTWLKAEFSGGRHEKRVAMIETEAAN